MLVLTRSRFEEIVLKNGDDLICLSVLGIKGGKVRIGIQAPAHIHIVRSEISEATRKTKAIQETNYVCYTDEVTKINTEPSGDLFRSPEQNV